MLLENKCKTTIKITAMHNINKCHDNANKIPMITMTTHYYRNKQNESSVWADFEVQK